MSIADKVQQNLKTNQEGRVYVDHMHILFTSLCNKLLDASKQGSNYVTFELDYARNLKPLSIEQLGLNSTLTYQIGTSTLERLNNMAKEEGLVCWLSQELTMTPVPDTFIYLHLGMPGCEKNIGFLGHLL